MLRADLPVTVRQEAIQQIYDENKEKFQTARSSLKKEDADRGLYTLEPVRSDIIEYPTFSGLPSEDLLKFVETMQQRRWKLSSGFRKHLATPVK